jgi:hypothetical protein
MKLFLEASVTIDDPPPEQMAKAVKTEKFAILSEACDSGTYIQFLRRERRNPPLTLEYQEGSTDNHFRAKDADITSERIVAAFWKYATGDDSWKRDFDWEPLKLC